MTCLELDIIFPIPLGVASGAGITHLTFNIYLSDNLWPFFLHVYSLRVQITK